MPQDLRWNIGPRMAALLSVLTGRFHLSKVKACELLEYIFKWRISPGTVCAFEHQTSCALERPCQEALQAVQQAQCGRHGDETSWPQAHKGNYGWLWLLATKVVAVFGVHDRRDKEAALTMVGHSGEHATVTDRFGSWLSVLGALNQFCWAHLGRDFKAIAQCKDEAMAQVGSKLFECAQEVFARWREKKHGALSHEEMVAALNKVRGRVKEELERGRRCEHKAHRGLCKRLLEQESHLWVFLEVEGLAPDNNHAERLLRNAVLWRKRSGGSASERGSRFTERILTSIESLRLQGRDVLDYLEAAIASWRLNLSPPSLLPS